LYSLSHMSTHSKCLGSAVIESFEWAFSMA
jgi:hypothetical protein